LSKVLAPALCIGYVVAPAPLIERIAAHRSYIDMQGDQVLEYAVAELQEGVRRLAAAQPRAN
jgi:GntR family transcriptional regulator/MocR family aminotransferase